MITEQICLDIVLTLYQRTSTMKRELNLDDTPDAQPIKSQAIIAHGLPPSEVYRELLPKYSLSVVDTAIRWLKIGGYITYSGWGLMAPRQVMHLADKGV